MGVCCDARGVFVWWVWLVRWILRLGVSDIVRVIGEFWWRRVGFLGRSGDVSGLVCGSGLRGMCSGGVLDASGLWLLCLGGGREDIRWRGSVRGCWWRNALVERFRAVAF